MSEYQFFWENILERLQQPLLDDPQYLTRLSELLAPNNTSSALYQEDLFKYLAEKLTNNDPEIQRLTQLAIRLRILSQYEDMKRFVKQIIQVEEDQRATEEAERLAKKSKSEAEEIWSGLSPIIPEWQIIEAEETAPAEIKINSEAEEIWLYLSAIPAQSDLFFDAIRFLKKIPLAIVVDAPLLNMVTFPLVLRSIQSLGSNLIVSIYIKEELTTPEELEVFCPLIRNLKVKVLDLYLADSWASPDKFLLLFNMAMSLKPTLTDLKFTFTLRGKNYFFENLPHGSLLLLCEMIRGLNLRVLDLFHYEDLNLKWTTVCKAISESTSITTLVLSWDQIIAFSVDNLKLLRCLLKSPKPIRINFTEMDYLGSKYWELDLNEMGLTKLFYIFEIISLLKLTSLKLTLVSRPENLLEYKFVFRRLKQCRPFLKSLGIRFEGTTIDEIPNQIFLSYCHLIAWSDLTELIFDWEPLDKLDSTRWRQLLLAIKSKTNLAKLELTDIGLDNIACADLRLLGAVIKSLKKLKTLTIEEEWHRLQYDSDQLLNILFESIRETNIVDVCLGRGILDRIKLNDLRKLCAVVKNPHLRRLSLAITTTAIEADPNLVPYLFAAIRESKLRYLNLFHGNDFQLSPQHWRLYANAIHGNHTLVEIDDESYHYLPKSAKEKLRMNRDFPQMLTGICLAFTGIVRLTGDRSFLSFVLFDILQWVVGRELRYEEKKHILRFDKNYHTFFAAREAQSQSKVPRVKKHLN